MQSEEKLTEIDNEIGRLSKAVETACVRFNGISQRLGKVCRVEAEVAESKKELAPSLTGLGEALRLLSNGIEGLTERMDSVLRRLEI